MNERRYWWRLVSVCFFGGWLLFYLVLNIAVKGGKVTMPDLRGMERSAAEYKIQSLGLHMDVKEERFSSTAPYGSVLDQDLQAGSTIKRGRSVEVILSKGSKIVNVPQLAGLSSTREATLLLEQNGLELGVTDSIHDPSPADTVLAQAPEAGVEVARGEQVSLLSSLGPSQQAWVMPNLKGGDASVARMDVEKMGLILRSVTEKQVAGVAPDSVVAQSLTPGARVQAGDELSLVVAAGGANQAGVRLADLSYQVPNDGVTERRVIIIVTDVMGQRAVYNRMVRPGENVNVEARVHGAGKYTVSLGGSDVEEKAIP